MKKKYILCAMIFIISFLFAGCGNNNVEYVKNRIDSIESTENIKDGTIDKIKEEYDSLSNRNKKKVDNYYKLESALESVTSNEINNITIYFNSMNAFSGDTDSYIFKNKKQDVQDIIDKYSEYMTDEEKEYILTILGLCMTEDEVTNKVKEELDNPNSFELEDGKINMYVCGSYYDEETGNKIYHSNLNFTYDADGNTGIEREMHFLYTLNMEECKVEVDSIF